MRITINEEKAEFRRVTSVVVKDAVVLTLILVVLWILYYFGVFHLMAEFLLIDFYFVFTGISAFIALYILIAFTIINRGSANTTA